MKSITLALIFVLSALVGCENEEPSPPPEKQVQQNSSLEDPLKIHPDPKGLPYFPEGKEEGWYTRVLREMEEPSIQAEVSNPGAEVYRFLYLPTWYRPLAIRVYRDEGDIWEVRTVRLSGQGGFATHGEIDLEGTSELHREEIDSLRRLIKNDDVLNINDLQQVYFNSLGDGDHWILEAVVDGKYKMVDFQNPEYVREKADVGIEMRDLSSYIEACEYFLTLAEVEIPSRTPVNPTERTSR